MKTKISISTELDLATIIAELLKHTKITEISISAADSGVVTLALADRHTVAPVFNYDHLTSDQCSIVKKALAGKTAFMARWIVNHVKLDSHVRYTPTEMKELVTCSFMAKFDFDLFDHRIFGHSQKAQPRRSDSVTSRCFNQMFHSEPVIRYLETHRIYIDVVNRKRYLRYCPVYSVNDPGGYTDPKLASCQADGFDGKPGLTPSPAFNDFLEKGGNPDSYRLTSSGYESLPHLPFSIKSYPFSSIEEDD